MHGERVVLIVCTIWTILVTYWFSVIYAPQRFPGLHRTGMIDIGDVAMGVFLGYCSSLALPCFILIWNSTKKR